MPDSRTQLPIGTQLQWEQGRIYEITGSAIGFGGGSIIYPARRIILQEGCWQPDGFSYVLKECYPVSAAHAFVRRESGEIVPENCREESFRYLHRAQQMQLTEGSVSQTIYRTASRMIPIRDASRTISLTQPGKEAVTVSNTITVMESVSEKGRSLSDWLKERRRFSPAEAFRIIQQLLFSLREIHQAGYLHLDIQDGNVFLRGTLTQEDTSELVTLIDFGSARPMTNGKTLPIQDRVVFTTDGFSAPEILLRNDGTLQLGAEADLYSVGCLALYLLTGHKADSRLLLANRSGIYLKPNQLRRIQCPKHLIDPIQRVLSKALETEPEKRYHSANEMLHDVTDLVAALQPYRTDLRSVRYDAFICYKHGPVDSSAAVTLQRALENYRAPKGVAQSRKPFRRVFVDEGELSSCADFGEQIREALKHSGWLIVVCSPDTPTSAWVQLEIDTFLEYHDRSRILAVLTDGDEKTAFPPQLRGTADGEGEVLASDARGNDLREVTKKLRSDALLKLAAPMLGTTFDTLKQRQKLYLLQRVAAVTAGFLIAAVGFAAYALNRANVIADQAVRIEQEYRNALINESLFLAEQAEKRLNDSDPLGAMELALAALPSEAQDRPVLTEAEYILGKALGIYTTPNAAESTATAVGVIDTAHPRFLLEESGHRIFIWGDGADFGSVIQAWDAQSLSLLWEYSTTSTVYSEPICSEKGGLIVLTYDKLISIDAGTGQENWVVPMKDTVTVSASQDGTRLMLISGEQGDYSGSDQDFQTPHALTASILSADTGEILSSVPFEVDGSQYVQRNICISPDLKWAAIPTVDEGHDDFYWYDYNSLYLVDLETGKCELLLDSQAQICAMKFIGDRLAVIRASGYTLITRHNVTYQYDMPYTYCLEAYDIGSQTLLWHLEQTDYMEAEGIHTVTETGYNDGETAGTGLLFTYEDRCTLVDLETGKKIRQYTLPSAAMTVNLIDNGFETITTDGIFASARFHLDTLMQRYIFKDTVSAVCRTEDVIFAQSNAPLGREYTIRKYALDKYDDFYTELFEADSQSWRADPFLTAPEGSLVLLTQDNQVCLLDTDTGESWQHTIPEQYAFSEYNILGIFEEELQVYWRSSSFSKDANGWINGNAPYYRIDLRSGEIQELIQPKQPHEHMVVYDIWYAEKAVLFSGIWWEQEAEQLGIYSWDLQDGTLRELYRCTLEPAPEGQETYLREGYRSGSLTLEPETNRLYFITETAYTDTLRKLVFLDLDSGEAAEISLHFLSEADAESDFYWQKICCQWNQAGTQMLLLYGNNIYVTDLQGELLHTIPVNAPVAARYTPDERCVMLISQDGKLSKYRIADGECLRTLDLTEHNDKLSSIYADTWAWTYPDDATLLTVTNYGGFLMDISGDTLKMKATIDHCIGYDAAGDRFLTAETDSYYGKNTTVGSFRRYTVEDMIRMANEILNN